MADVPSNASSGRTIAVGETANDTLELVGDHDCTIIDWLGTASGGFTDNSGNLFTSIALQWQVAPADALI